MNKKPWITLCMAMTLDGQVVTPGLKFPDFTSRRDRERLFEMRARNQVIIVGAGTVRAEGLQPLVRSEKWRTWRRQASGSAHPDVAVVSGSGDLDCNGNYFSETQNFHVFSHQVSPENLHRWISWHHMPNGTPSEDWIIAKLALLGYSKILLEGGPVLAHSFFKNNLIDEIYLTLVGKVLGGSSASGLAKGPSLAVPPCFKIMDVAYEGPECFLKLRRVMS